MSIAEEISRLQTAKEELKTSITQKGVTVPDSAKLDEYPQFVDAIGEDLLQLPDIEHEPHQKIVMLLNVKKDGANRFCINVDSVNEWGAPVGTLDWGDGTIDSLKPEDEAEGYEFYTRAEHQYDYDLLDATILPDGSKQVIATLTGAESDNWDYIYFCSNFSDANSADSKMSPNMLRKLAVQAGTQKYVTANLSRCRGLREFTGHGIKVLNVSSAGTIQKLRVTGETFDELTGSFLFNPEIDIPMDNPYRRINLTNSSLDNLAFTNLSNMQTILTISGSYGGITKLIAKGLPVGVNLSQSGMSRESLVALFESLGQAKAPLSSYLRLTISTAAGYADLTDEDKQIALDKGFTIA